MRENQEFAGARQDIAPNIKAAALLGKIGSREVTDTTLEPDEGLRPTVLANGRLQIDHIQCELIVDDISIPLTPIEIKLLEFLLINRGRFMDRSEITNALWREWHGSKNIVDINISNLRKKMSGDLRDILKTKSGRGYMLKDSEGELPSSS